MHFIGLDVHRQFVAYCVQNAAGERLDRGNVAATREALLEWVGQLPPRWSAAMEATTFSGWIYDTLRPFADDLAVGHPAAMEAISRGKKKSDALDAETLCDLQRAGLVPRVWVADPAWRSLRRLLRLRTGLLRQSTASKNRIASTLMELGVPYERNRLHSKRYFATLVGELDPDDDAALALAACRSLVEYDQLLMHRIERYLMAHPQLVQRVKRLQTIPGVGDVGALTWALEIGDPARFPSHHHAASYCGLTAPHRESAGKLRRGRLSKQRNAHLQRVLLELAKLAPRHNPELAALYQSECRRGHKNRATLAVARKLVRLLLAVDRRQDGYQPPAAPIAEEAPMS